MNKWLEWSCELRLKAPYFTLALALLSRRNLTICWWPVLVQWNRAVHPRRSFSSKSAPCWWNKKKNIQPIFLYLLCSCKMTGVKLLKHVPLRFLNTLHNSIDVFGTCSRKYAILSFPQLAANIKGVTPLAVVAFTFTPASNKRFAMLSCPI